MINSINDLYDKIFEWSEQNIPDGRVNENDSKGRKWLVDVFGIDDLGNLDDFFAHDQLTQQYIDNYNETDPTAKKGISGYKVEIGFINSCHKCFDTRHKGRLQFYNNDLSQKGARTGYAHAQSLGMLKYLKQQIES